MNRLKRFLDPEPLPGWPKYRPEAVFKGRVELFLARALYVLLRLRFEATKANDAPEVEP